MSITKNSERMLALIKKKAALALADLVKGLNESIEQDEISALSTKKERLELEKVALLAKLEQVEKDLFDIKTKLKSEIVDTTIEVVTVSIEK